MKTLDLHDRVLYGPLDEPGTITCRVDNRRGEPYEYDVMLDDGQFIASQPRDLRPAVNNG